MSIQQDKMFKVHKVLKDAGARLIGTYSNTDNRITTECDGEVIRIAVCTVRT